MPGQWRSLHGSDARLGWCEMRQHRAESLCSHVNGVNGGMVEGVLIKQWNAIFRRKE
jgi:hypothetical protein